jgi:Tfp pilus assembly protein PilX
MSATFTHSLGSERGSAFILALVALLVLTVTGLSLVSLSATEFTISTNWRDYSRAFYAADAGVEGGVASLKALLVNNPTPTAANLAAIATPTLTTSGMSLTSFAVTPVVGAVGYPTIMPAGVYAGLIGNVTDYQIAAAASSGFAKSSLRQGYKYITVPLFQFGVFYGKGVDLEIAPGPNMTFNGRVHSNSNIYVGAGSSLQFDSRMTTAGTIYRHLKRDSATTWGNNPQIKDANGTYQTLNFDATYKPGFTATWPDVPSWTNQLKNTYGPAGTDSTVKDGSMGIGQITPPIPALFNNPTNPDVVSHQLIEMVQSGDSAALKGAKLYSAAGLRIVNGSATNASGGPVTLPAGAINTTPKSFYDGREGKTINITEVDISVLRSSGVAPANGVLYVADTGSPPNSIRLVNGSQLPSQGLSVVSPNPVYVQGDYNTVSKVPAAILGDAITVLSNNWTPNVSDRVGDQPVGTRPASSTTVNAAFALGPNAESALNAGNGQLENVIRFLEDWSGTTFTYAGSIVSLWHSQQATGNWKSPGAYYNPPVRAWSYDTLFNTKPPPGAPTGIIMTKGRWAQQ